MIDQLALSRSAEHGWLQMSPPLGAMNIAKMQRQSSHEGLARDGAEAFWRGVGQGWRGGGRRIMNHLHSSSQWAEFPGSQGHWGCLNDGFGVVQSLHSTKPFAIGQPSCAATFPLWALTERHSCTSCSMMPCPVPAPCLVRGCHATEEILPNTGSLMPFLLHVR